MVMQGDGFQGDFLKEKDAAQYLTVSLSTFRRRVKAGHIKKYQVAARRICYRRSDLESYIESQQRTTAEGK